jgi:aspartyl-tRNA(Asn)/glutamyl-tRNA(Gln) amidotransferase subunit C
MSSGSSIIDVKHLAKLTSVTVSDDQSKQLEQQFVDTLKVVKKLEELDTSKINPTPQVTGLINIFREDVIDLDRQLSQSLALKNAKHTYHGYFVVPAIMDR